MQKAEGLAEATELTLAQIPDVNDAISLERIAGATFCPTDGYIRPLEILRGYVEAAERKGVRFMWDSAVTGIKLDDDERISEIITESESVVADNYVNAAGPWAARIAAILQGIAAPTPFTYPGHGPSRSD